MTVEERVKPAATFQPEIASLNMGSINFGLFPMLSRFKQFKHDWEPQALEGSRDLVFRNTFKDIEFILRTSAAAARASSSSATTPPISTISAISPIVASSSRRSSSRRCSASWAASAPIPKTSCT